MIDARTIDEIKSRMDIYEVVSDFVQLKKAGSSYKALSPFTEEKTPSFVVTPSRGIFKCFSTGIGGDAIKFLMEIDGLNYVEALRYLANKYGIEVREEEVTQEHKNFESERESLFIMLNFAKEHFVKNLWEEQEGKNIGLSYFKERGFSDDTIRNFDLGYALDQWQGLMDATKSNGYNQEYLERTGLMIVKEDKSYDRFRGRVTFPIHNVTGKVIAFGARKLRNDDNSPKYINSPETELYQKSKILYGIFQAKNEIRNLDNCYLVEGYTDVISMAQFGVRNVVAASGTALTDDQIKLISRFTKNVTVLFDGDKAGIKASLRGIDMMLEGGLNVNAVPFPSGEDPDSYANKLGAIGFREFLQKESKDFISFKTGVLLGEGAGPVQRAESIRDIVASIAKVPDALKRTVYIQACSGLLQVDEATLFMELNKLILKSTKEGNQLAEVLAESNIAPAQEAIVRSVKVDDIVQVQERESMRMLINYGSELIEEAEGIAFRLVDYFLAEIEDVDFQTPVYQRILELYKEKLAQDHLLTFEELVAHPDHEVRNAAVDLASERYEISPKWIEKYEIYVAHERDRLKSSTFTNILRFKIRVIRKMISENMLRLKDVKDETEQVQIQLQHKTLKELEMTIANILGNVTMI